MKTGITEISALAILEAAPDAVLVVAARGDIVWANRRAERIFGCAQGELVGQAVESLLPEQLRAGHAKHREGYLAAPSTRQMGRGMKLIAQRKGGEQFRVDVSLSPVTIGSQPHVICTVRDLSEYLGV